MSNRGEITVSFDEAALAAEHALVELSEGEYKGFVEICDGGLLCSSDESVLREGALSAELRDVTLVTRVPFSKGASELKTDECGRVIVKKT